LNFLNQPYHFSQNLILLIYFSKILVKFLGYYFKKALTLLNTRVASAVVAIVTASGKLKRLQAQEADNVVQYDGHGLQSGLLSSFFFACTYLKRWFLFL
jgi:hypothetical protein